MAKHDNGSEVATRTRRGRRRTSPPAVDGRPSMMQMLWSDLRHRRIPSEPSNDELAYLEMEEAAQREADEVLARAHSLDEAKVDQLRRRYEIN